MSDAGNPLHGAQSSREFDVVVFGATGYTGRLISEYLATHPERERLRWAIAGRSEDKLRDLRVRLTELDPRCATLTLIVADVADIGTLSAMTARTRVLLTTVGPYARTGEPVLAAAVETGTDYVDLTGEPPWWKRMVASYDDAARASGARIVPSCGYESIPHDMAALWAAGTFAADFPGRTIETLDVYIRGRGKFSTGTYRSALGVMGELGRRDASGSSRGSREATRDETKAPQASRRLHRVANGWAVPMPTIEPMVVARSRKLGAFDAAGSAAATGTPQRSFAYGQYIVLPKLSWVVGLGAAVGSLLVLSRFKPTRDLLWRRAKDNDGPTPEERARSWFEVEVRARSGDVELVGRMRGKDPGYTETSRMMAEAALALALDRERLPPRFGVLTPASGIGAPLLDRLAAIGLGYARPS